MWTDVESIPDSLKSYHLFVSEILDCVVGYNEQAYIVGDLNVRLDHSIQFNLQFLEWPK